MMNGTNVRFVPGDLVFKVGAFRKQVRSAAAKSVTFRKSLKPYYPNAARAIELLVLNVKIWLEKGF
jgi:hypothetical protein